MIKMVIHYDNDEIEMFEGLDFDGHDLPYLVNPFNMLFLQKEGKQVIVNLDKVKKIDFEGDIDDEF